MIRKGELWWVDSCDDEVRIYQTTRLASGSSQPAQPFFPSAGSKQNQDIWKEPVAEEGGHNGGYRFRDC